MENLNTSVDSQRTSQTPLVSRIAKQLVCQQLSQLAHGKLVVKAKQVKVHVPENPEEFRKYFETIKIPSI